MSTVDVVQESVMAGLLRGEHTPGTWLRQDELAEQLGVSKIPVREALQRLAAIGLLRFETNRGVIVPELSAEEAKENYALRKAIEPRLLEQAFAKLSIVDLAEAELALSSTDLNLPEANWAFHRALYRSSGWERGLSMTKVLHASFAPYVVLYHRDLSDASHSEEEHTAMLTACRDGNENLALELLHDHLDTAATTLLDYLTNEYQADTERKTDG